MKKIPELQMPTDKEIAENWNRRRLKNKADPNCITHWWPRIKGHVPTPCTEIVPLKLTHEKDKELWEVLDGKPPPDWWEGWVGILRGAARDISTTGPWFLRTGVFSGKHNWRRCCAVTDLGLIGKHALAIFYESQCVDALGLPYHVWAVREWLPGPAIMEYERYEGMPVRREFRAFAENGEVLCIHPYWPPDSFDAETAAMPGLQAMNELGKDEAAIIKMVSIASMQVQGEWSIDCLSTDNGWYVTDMALANQSYHWQPCQRETTPPDK